MVVMWYVVHTVHVCGTHTVLHVHHEYIIIFIEKKKEKKIMLHVVLLVLHTYMKLHMYVLLLYK